MTAAMIRPVLIATGAGIASAVLYLSANIGSILSALLLWSAALPIFVLGMSFGAASVLIASLAGFLVMSAAMGFKAGLVYVFLLGLPAGWLVRLALLSRTPSSAQGSTKAPIQSPMEWYPPGHLLAWIAVFSAGFVLAFDLLYWSQGGLRTLFSQLFAPILEHEGLRQDLTKRHINPENFLDLMVNVAPAAIGVMWLGILATNLQLGQVLANRAGLGLRPNARFHDLELPPQLLIALAGALILSFLPGQGGFLAASISAVLAFPYFLLGLSVVHAISRAWPGRLWLLALIYFFVIYLLVPFFILWGIGLLEPWIGLRKRFS